MDYNKETEKRIAQRLKRSYLDVNTKLEHFALISYKVPVEKMEHLIPKPFKLWTFIENGTEYALLSAVPFKDKDFAFYRIAKFIKLSFYQTNFRTYIIDERDNSTSAWFFGTTLGSFLSIIPKRIWKMPWEKGKYNFNFTKTNGVYSSYNMGFKSKLGDGNIQIESTKTNAQLLNGFKSIDEQIHILTHPIIGYYYRSKKEIGTYEIWHPKMNLKIGKAKHLYFELFEKLGFLTKEEMNKPHSVLITPEIEFDILLPPKMLKS